MKQFIAAVENGADAVYMGGPLFNARLNASNFSLEEIEEAVDYGHLRGVKTYITMNTLLDNDELLPALKFANELYRIGVDALIIQDLGLGKLVRENIPGFEIHMSTQATCYNVEGVEAAKELGYSRAVLARECTLEEIRSCIRPDLPEIEIFVHGALCMCYSGQCQLSRYIGGRSGNKGACAQPCRLPYKDGKDMSYPLSPKDLSLIDHLGDLIDCGVSSLKIEGRMKSPEYVATVVRIYRKYIDLYYKNRKYEVSPEDRLDLLQIFNRGGFTEGYLYSDPEENLLSGKMPKNEGVHIGKVIGTKKGGLYLEALLDREIKMQDIVELTESKESFRVTYLEKLKGRYILGDLKGEPKIGEEIRRVVSFELNTQAEKTFETGKSSRKLPVDMSIYSYIGSPLKLVLRSGNVSVEKTLDANIEEARGRGTTDDDIRKQLLKTGDSPFAPGRVRISKDDNIFIPLSKLNELRREGLQELEETVKNRFKHDAYELNPEISEEDFSPSVYPSDLQNMNDTLILPQLTKGKFDEFLRVNADRISEKLKASDASVLVHNIGWIKPFSERGIKVIGGYGLNITNVEAKKAYMSLGMTDTYMSSVELLSRDEMQYVPLMITEHEMKDGTLTDRKGEKYTVQFDPETHKTYIFAE
ncbi:MAG: U32 family peptidase [Clostridia bacterium]|nr:U32 family peptidase [Clostridia bacterium]